MIATAWLTIRVALEIALAVHCDRWAHLEVGDRCIEPRDHARGFELIAGVHPISFGVNTCTEGNCE